MSRIFIFFIWILFDLSVQDHQAKGVELFQIDSNEIFFNSFTKWDAAHYLNIAKYGYLKDYYFVFFPIYPFLIKLISLLVQFLLPINYSIDKRLIVSGLIISNFFSIVNPLILKQLLDNFKLNKKTTDLTIMLFIFNPATVFNFGIYTESLFCFFTFTSFYFYEKNKIFISSIFFLLAGGVRSNGILNSVPLIFDLLYKTKSWAINFIPILSSTVLYFFWNYFIYINLCNKHVDDQNQEDSVCKSSNINLYSYLQSKYWNVGFMTQYSFNQIPNFILASPIIYYSSLFLYEFINDQIRSNLSMIKVKYSFHLLSLLLLGIFYAHIQITTRLIFSSSPVIYVFFAEKIIENSFISGRKYKNYLIYLYFGCYFIFGIFFHVNFFPWT